MTKTERPKCDTCDEILSVKHILIDCNKYHQQRKTHDIPINLKELLGEQSPIDKLINFLKDIDVLNSI